MNITRNLALCLSLIEWLAGCAGNEPRAASASQPMFITRPSPSLGVVDREELWDDVEESREDYETCLIERGGDESRCLSAKEQYEQDLAAYHAATHGHRR